MPTRKETSPRPSDRLGAGPAGLGLPLPGRSLVLPPAPAVPPRLGGGRRATPPRPAPRGSRRPRAEGARPLRPVAAGAGADAAAVRGGGAGGRDSPRLPPPGGRPPRRP